MRKSSKRRDSKSRSRSKSRRRKFQKPSPRNNKKKYSSIRTTDTAPNLEKNKPLFFKGTPGIELIKRTPNLIKPELQDDLPLKIPKRKISKYIF